MDDSGIEHIPVLADTLLETVQLKPDAVMVDATLGCGGHSLLLGRQLGPQGTLIGLDLDAQTLTRARARLDSLICKLHLVQTNFACIGACLQGLGIDRVDFVLADLGYSSIQLEEAEIGLSFQSDMPLDMRIDRSLKTTAADIVNKTDETSLANLIYEYGEDRASRRIARFIVEQRQRSPIETTGQLAALVVRALYRPGRKHHERIHPATRTFQALRIAVNHELDHLERLLDDVPPLLNSGGLFAVISFHSLEDRRVKWAFKTAAQNGLLQIKTKKPLVPSAREVQDNRRARSAKLRIAQRVEQGQDVH